MKEKKNKVDKALLKVALGGKALEVVEEYQEVDGVMKLTKRRETVKDIPPDLKAVQILLAEEGKNGAEIESMTDEELEEERLRLLKQLSKATEKQRAQQKD